MTRRFGGLLAAAAAGQMAFADVGISPFVADGLAAINPVSLARLLLRRPPVRPRRRPTRPPPAPARFARQGSRTMTETSCEILRPAAFARRGNMFAVASGKGGVGKTWLAISLAHALARAGRKTLLFDGDLGLANVDIQLGLDARRRPRRRPRRPADPAAARSRRSRATSTSSPAARDPAGSARRRLSRLRHLIGRPRRA